MHIRSRNASLAFKVALVIVGTVGIICNTGLTQGGFEVRFLFMFTNLSNLAVVVYFWFATVRIALGKDGGHTPWRPKLKYALMLAITVTWLVAHFLINGGMVFQEDGFHGELLVLHYIVPIAAILDWLLFDEKGHMGWLDPLTWPAFPLAYVVYIFVLVFGFGVSVREESRWPYDFLDVDANGLGFTLLMIVALLVIFLVLGYVYVAIDKKLAKAARK